METNFGVSPTFPKSHFVALSEILVERGLVLFDLGFNRVPRWSFTQALERHGIQANPEREYGKPATFNVLFCRDLVVERDSPHHYIVAPTPVTVDQIIKAMIICELHGLNDIAVDTAVRFSEVLSARFDVEEAIRLLADVNCRAAILEYVLRDLWRAAEKRAVAGEERADAMQDRAGAAEQSLRAAEARIRGMENSTSWRVTRPLRAAKSLLAPKAP